MTTGTLATQAANSPFTGAQISHADIAAFADDSVNLKREDVAEYREQVARLREKLDKYAADHPDYASVITPKPASRDHFKTGQPGDSGQPWL